MEQNENSELENLPGKISKSLHKSFRDFYLLSFGIECSKSRPEGGGGGEGHHSYNVGDVPPMDSRTGYHFGLGRQDWVSFLLRNNIAFLSKFTPNLYRVF